MSIEIIQKGRKLEMGWINIGYEAWPSIGVLPSPKAKAIHGISLTSLDQIKDLIAFLKRCQKELEK